MHISQLLFWTIATIIILVIAIVVAAALLRPRKNADDDAWPFYAKRLLSAPEQVLYFRLAKALPEHIVFAQVQLSRFLGVKKGNNSQSWLNRINRMSADFVVCHKDASVVAVIELDDASHDGERRRIADAKKDKALSSAGVNIMRWQASNLPDEATIRSLLLPNEAFNTDARRRGSAPAAVAG